MNPSARERRLSAVVLGIVVAGAALAAVLVHRRGHTTGDDFALYLNQARSLFEGNVAEVVTANRFLWKNSVGVTPPIYPWGFPILLAPLVRLWGIDGYDRLKLIEVAALAAWLVLFHGIVRRRAGRIVALVLTAGFATAPLYLLHTDQLLTEFPHMVAVAVVIWYLDRVLLRHRLTEAPRPELITLGLLIVIAYNVRRESVVLVAAVAATQLVDVAGSWRGRGETWRGRVRAIPWRRVLTPHLAFVAGAVLFQFLLPSTLVPDNGNSISNITRRLFTDYPKHLTLQLGIGDHPLVGRIVMAAAAAGAVVTCIRRPRLNVPLAVLTATTMLVVGTHFRMVARYYLQVTPLIVYFATMLLVSYAELVMERHRVRTWTRRIAVTVLVAPALWLVVLHVWALPARVDAANRFNDAGQVQAGGLTERTAPAFAAVEQHTDADDVIVYYRVRTLTLHTDRRGVQTQLLQKAARLGDYFLQNLRSDYSQPRATRTELLTRGWEIVWEDPSWRLWRIVDDPQPAPPSP